MATFFVSDTGNHCIRKILQKDNSVIVVTGNPMSCGYRDSNLYSSHFNHPGGLVIDNKDNIIVADMFNNAIRKINITENKVSTITSKLNRPEDIAIDNDGNIYIANSGNFDIRKIKNNGEITIIAGASKEGFADGLALESLFSTIISIEINRNGDILCSDRGNNAIRIIVNGTNVISYTFYEKEILKIMQSSRFGSIMEIFISDRIFSFHKILCTVRCSNIFYL